MYEIQVYNREHSKWYSLDISGETIAITYQANDIASIAEKASYSQEIRLLPSPTNIEALGLPHVFENTAEVPYQAMEAVVYADGSLIFKNALLRIVSIKDKFINVQVYDARKQFIQTLKDMGSINDLPWSLAGGIYSPNYIKNSPAFNEQSLGFGWKNVFWCVADFSTSPYGSGSILSDLWRHPMIFLEGQVPFVQFNKVVHEIMMESGYTYQIDFAENDYNRYNKYLAYAHQLAKKLPVTNITADPDSSGGGWMRIGGWNNGVTPREDIVHVINVAPGHTPGLWNNLPVARPVPNWTTFGTTATYASECRLNIRGVTNGIDYSYVPVINFVQTGWYRIRVKFEYWLEYGRGTATVPTFSYYPSISVIEDYDTSAAHSYEQSGRLEYERPVLNVPTPRGGLTQTNGSAAELAPYAGTLNEVIEVHSIGTRQVAIIPHIFIPDATGNYAVSVWAGYIQEIEFVEYIEDGSEVSISQVLPIKRNLPDISCADYIKEFMLLFAQSYYVDEAKKNVYFYDMETVKRNARDGKYLDWTKKIQPKTGTTKFMLQNYAQENSVAFKESSLKFKLEEHIDVFFAPIPNGYAQVLFERGEPVFYRTEYSTGLYTEPALLATREEIYGYNKVFFIAVPRLGDSFKWQDLDNLHIEDENLQATKKFIESLFESYTVTRLKAYPDDTPESPRNTYNMAKIPVQDFSFDDSNTTPYYGHVNRVNGKTEFDSGATPRLVTLSSVTTPVNVTQKWNRTPNEYVVQHDMRIALKVSASDIAYEYVSLFTGLLRHTKVLTDIELWLSPEDIAAYRPYLPVYLEQFGAFFYVNKITNFINGRFTKVELIKLTI